MEQLGMVPPEPGEARSGQGKEFHPSRAVPAALPWNAERCLLIPTARIPSSSRTNPRIHRWEPRWDVQHILDGPWMLNRSWKMLPGGGLSINFGQEQPGD